MFLLKNIWVVKLRYKEHIRIDQESEGTRGTWNIQYCIIIEVNN